MGPRPVVRKPPALEVAVTRVVELRDDQPLNVATGDRLAQPTRLLLTGRGQRTRHRDVAVHHRTRAEGALAVPREDRELHSVEATAPPRTTSCDRSGRGACRRRRT